MKINSKYLPPNIARRIADPELKKSYGTLALTTAEIEDKNGVKLERELHAQIEAWGRRNGVVLGHNRMDRKSYYTPGWPDFTFCWQGYAMAWEAKGAGKEPTEEQWRVISQMRDNGWSVSWGTSYLQFLDFLEIHTDKRGI